MCCTGWVGPHLPGHLPSAPAGWGAGLGLPVTYPSHPLFSLGSPGNLYRVQVSPQVCVPACFGQSPIYSLSVQDPQPGEKWKPAAPWSGSGLSS